MLLTFYILFSCLNLVVRLPESIIEFVQTRYVRPQPGPVAHGSMMVSRSKHGIIRGLIRVSLTVLLDVLVQQAMVCCRNGTGVEEQTIQLM